MGSSSIMELIKLIEEDIFLQKNIPMRFENKKMATIPIVNKMIFKCLVSRIAFPT